MTTKTPQPGAESVGPVMVGLVTELRRATEVSKFLMDQAQNLLKDKTVVCHASAVVPATGLLDLPVYQVPMGFQFSVNRWSMEAVGYNAFNPYISANGQIFLYSGLRYALGAMLDFAPKYPRSFGELLPLSQVRIAASGFPRGALGPNVFQSGEWVSIRIVDGPVNTAVYARIQGYQKAI